MTGSGGRLMGVIKQRFLWILGDFLIKYPYRKAGFR